MNRLAIFICKEIEKGMARGGNKLGDNETLGV